MSELPRRVPGDHLTCPGVRPPAVGVAATDPRRRRTAQSFSVGLTASGRTPVLGAGDVGAVAACVVEPFDLLLHWLLTASGVARPLAGDVALRRRNLVVVPRNGRGSSVAVGVEGTVNRVRRLQAICAGWALGRHVAVIRHYATRAPRVAHVHDVIEVPSLTHTRAARGVSLAV